MPSINKTRVSNVLFDDNLRFYDDIIIPVNEGTLNIEAENGTGKTLLMQCILQSVSPLLYFKRKNAELRDQPTIKNLMTNNKNTTMHSMIEWTLDEGAGFDYMLTGFCAKRVKEENSDGVTDGINHFNYVILYNADAPISLESIPLRTEGKNNEVKRLKYSELQKFLRDLSSREKKCIVKTFTKKKEYINFLNSYNISASEIELMRNINLKEGGSEEYFTERYKTSYDFIVGEVVERIESVDEVNLQGTYKTSDDLAESLYGIKTTIEKLKYQQKKLDEVEIAEECFRRILEVNNNLINELKSRENTFEEVLKGLNSQIKCIKESESVLEEIKSEISDKEEQKEAIKLKSQENESKIQEIENLRQNIENQIAQVNEWKQILKNRSQKAKFLKQASEHQAEIEVINKGIADLEKTGLMIDESIADVKKDIEIKEMEDLYVEYSRLARLLNNSKKSYELATKDIQDVIKLEKETQSNLAYVLMKEREKIESSVGEIQEEIDVLSEEASGLTDKIQENKLKVKLNENKIDSNERTLEKNTKTIKENEQSIQENDINIKTSVEKEIVAINEAYDIYKTRNDIGIDTVEVENILEELRDDSNKFNSVDGIEKLRHQNENLIEIDNLAEEKKIINNSQIKDLEEKDLEKELKEILKPLNEALDESNSKKEEYLEEFKDLERDEKNINERISECEDEGEKFKELFNGIKDIITKNNAEDRFDLAEILANQSDLIKKKLFTTETRINELEDKINEMEKNKGISISEDTRKCYEILSKAYTSTAFGMDFNKNLSIEERDIYLSRMNLIPVGIILGKVDYNNLLRNKALQEKISDLQTYIINIDTVKDGSSLSNEVLYVTSKDKEFYINEERRKIKIEELKKELDKLKREYDKISDELDKVTKDLNRVLSINHVYKMNFIESLKEDIESYKREKRDCLKEIENCKLKIEKISSEIEGIENEIEAQKKYMNKKMDDLKKEIQRLNKENNNISDFRSQMSGIKSSLLKLENIIAQINTYQGNIFEAKQLIITLSNENTSCISENKELENDTQENKRCNEKLNLQLNSVNDKLSDLNDKKNKLIGRIENIDLDLNEVELIPVDTKPKISDKSIDTLKSELKVIERDKFSKAGNLGELQDTINSRELEVKEKKSKINSKFISFEELELRKNTISKNNENVFKELNGRLLKLEDELKENTNKLNTEKTKRTTKIALKDQAEENAQNIDVRDDVEIPSNYDPENEMSQLKRKKDKCNEDFNEYREYRTKLSSQLSDITDLLEKLKEEDFSNRTKINELKAQQVKIEQVLENNNLIKDESLGLYEGEKFNINSYELKIKRHYKRIEDVSQKHNSIKIECLNKLKDSAFDIIGILSLIDVKTTIGEVKEQSNKIEQECFGVLRDTKERLMNDLEKMNHFKETFIDQCLKKAEKLLEKIKKLQKLTSIEVDGEKRPLIKVQLHELPAESRKEKMKNHIETILGQIDVNLDSEEATAAQQTRISKALASSKLLEQVIINAKRCEVSVYIPRNEDDIMSNGKYVRWGATASGGQRNVMYFTVTIGLLLFIRELSTISDVSKQKKVLYVDGAFKASASIHLWECIYPLLKDNNIQFIVTNMGTPKSLMKMFDTVVYLVGRKKSIDGKKVIENGIGQQSRYKSDERTLKTESILHNFGEYRIPKKEASYKVDFDEGEQLLLFEN